MTQIVIDIETIPTEDQTVIAEIAAGITPPGNMTKADTIAAWADEKKPGLVEKAVRDTSFDGGLGAICCIGFAIEGEPAKTISVNKREDEQGVLDAFCEAVQDSCKPGQARLEVIGHNVLWDLRFILQRCIVHAVRPPAVLLAAMNSKPWGENVRDTMLMWNPDRDRRISLDKLCKILRVPTSKGDFDGSKVWDAYKAGEFEKIATYCAGDVEATRTVFRRLTFTAFNVAAQKAA